MADELDIANTLTGRQKAPAEALLEEGAAFGPFRIERAIGSGGMGAVYLARTADGERVALKVIRPELADATGRARMVAEGTQARKVRHPNVVRVDTVGAVDDRLYLQMEFVEGRPLRAFMTDSIRSALNLPAVEAVMTAILDGLHEIHVNGLVHRDMKPENVIISGTPGEPGFTLKIVDFGIARPEGGKTTGATGPLGSSLYMAPEQRTRPDHVEPSADIYSVGRMLYEMLMGVLPEGVWSPPSATEPGVPPALDEVIRKAISVPPKARFQSAPEFRAAMDAALHPSEPARRTDLRRDDGPPPLPDDPPPPDTQAERGRRAAEAPDGSPDAAAAAARREAEAARTAAEADARRAAAASEAARIAAEVAQRTDRPEAQPAKTRRWPIVAGVVALLLAGAAVFLSGEETPNGWGDDAGPAFDGGNGGQPGFTGTQPTPPQFQPDPPPSLPQQPANAAPGGTWFDGYNNSFSVTVTGDEVYGVGTVPPYGLATLAGSLFGVMQLTTGTGEVLATFTNGTVDPSHWTGTVFENGRSYRGQLHFNHSHGG